MLTTIVSRRAFTRFLCSASVLTGTSAASAQYVVNLAAETGGSNTGYIFFPRISVTENGGATAAKVTFSSPALEHNGYHNFSVGADSVEQLTTADVVAEVNGTWLIRLETAAPNPQVYQYTADVSVNLPFAQLPRIESPDLAFGSTFDGTIDFELVGGSAVYPGAASTIRARLFDMDSNVLETAILPFGSTSWTPSVDVSALASIRVVLDTQNEAVDPSALNVLNVVPLNLTGAPGLGFGTHTLKYVASRNVELLVPEPIGLSGVFALAVMSRRRR